MKVSQQQAITHLDSVLKKYEQAFKRQPSYAADEFLSPLGLATRIDVVTSIVAALERLAPRNSYYLTSVQIAIKRRGTNNPEAIPELVGIARALKQAYEQGYLQEIQELIHGDIFSDFLDMADYLLGQGYKDAAAVIIGGVLEEHLRKLCEKHPIGTTTDGRPKKNETMNSELASHGVYNKLDQKNVTAWLELRNRAAHAEYDKYTEDQVKLMHDGIREFVARLPA